MENKFNMSAGDLGIPGLPNELRIVASFPDDTRTDQARMQDQTLRPFTISATLSKFPPSTQDIQGDFTKDDGDSFLIAAPEAETYRVEKSSNEKFEILKNQKGELSFIKYECVAASFEAANKAFYTFINPMVDFLSYSANCPLYVTRTRAYDENNQVTLLSYVAPYPNSVLNSSLNPIFPELVPVYALYREAKNSISYFYQFLCYFKILEGFRNKISIVVYQRLKNSGVQKQKDILPQDNHLDSAYQKYTGGSIWKFYDEVLNPEFRIAVAHYIKDDGSILNISDMEHQEKYIKVLYAAEVCVRTLIAKYNILLQTPVN